LSANQAQDWTWRKILTVPLVQALRVQYAMADEKLEEFQIADPAYAITSPVLIPLSEPQQGSNLILREALLSQSFRFRNGIVSIHSSV
jgi:hypothetical protein